MTNVNLITVLRDANPVAPQSSDDSELWAQIVASPGDSRLLSTATHRSARRRAKLTFLAGFAALAVCVGGAVAAGLSPWSTLSTQTPRQLFRSNPAFWNQDNHPNSNTAVISTSVRELARIQVPGVGVFQYWGARTRNQEWCEAFKGPDGYWAGTPVTSSGREDPAYTFGGNVPGCALDGNPPAPAGGFHIMNAVIGPGISGHHRAAANRMSLLFYGTVDDPKSATKVVDTTTGRSAPLLDNHYFVLLRSRRDLRAAKLEAVDRAGKVVRRAAPDELTGP